MKDKENFKLDINKSRERLIHLWNSYKCTDDKCQNEKCTLYKYVWEHIKICKDKNCKMKHCVSSRYILGHHSNCVDEKCEICLPVRNVVKSHKTKYNNELYYAVNILSDLKNQRNINLKKKKFY